MTNDEQMIAKGYRYICVPTNSTMCALYAKDMTMVGYILRDWPEVRFDVKKITPE